jgi:hypothetical protein
MMLVMERDYAEISLLPSSRRYKLIRSWIDRQDKIRKQEEAARRNRRGRRR